MEFTKIIDTDKATYVEIDNGGVFYITGYRSEADVLEFPAEVNGMRVAGPIGFLSNNWVRDTFVGRTENSDRTIVMETYSFETHEEEVKDPRKKGDGMFRTIKGENGEPDKVMRVLHEYNYDLFKDHEKKAEKVHEIALSEGMTMVGNRAFAGFKSLKRISLPESLSVIDDLGFADCSSLESIAIPSGVARIGECAFSCCSSLTEVTVPGNVKVIDYSAFEECSNLEKVTISDGVEKIGANAFLACKKLIRIELPDSLDTLVGYGDFSPFAYCDKELVVSYKGKDYRVADDEAMSLNLAVNGKLLKGSLLENIPDTPVNDFDYVELDDGTLCITDYTSFSSSVRIPETIDGKTVTCIEQGVIGRCGIEVIELPKTLKFIPCFADNSYDTFWLDDKAILKAVKLNNPELIPEYLFYGCANLREVSLPDFDTTFGYGTFWDCERLRYIRLPQTLTDVVDGIFEGCTSLKKLILPEGIKKFSAVAFNDIGDFFTPHLETIMLPDSLETITGLPFFCLSSLTELKIPDSVKKFDFAMEQCLCYNCNEKLKITLHGKTYGSIKYDDGSGLVSIENDPQIYDDVRDLVDCELPENWIKEQGSDGVEYL